MENLFIIKTQKSKEQLMSLLPDDKIYVQHEGISIPDPDSEIAIVWGINDVLDVRPDLSTEQAFVILQEVYNKHDACMGVTWDTLRIYADILFSTNFYEKNISS